MLSRRKVIAMAEQVSAEIQSRRFWFCEACLDEKKVKSARLI
jgi:hypothetical protein